MANGVPKQRDRDDPHDHAVRAEGVDAVQGLEAQVDVGCFDGQEVDDCEDQLLVTMRECGTM